MTLPDSIGPYRPVAMLQDDGITRSYRVEPPTPGERPKILKTFPLEPYADPDSRERFRREVIIQMSVHHANVWEVVDYGFWKESIPYLVSDDFGGQPLAAELERKGPFPLPRFRQAMDEILQGLEAVHAAGVVHRLLGTDKIWVTADGQCKISHFEFSSRQGMPRLTPSGVSMGAPDYAAPEQLFNAHHVDGRADLFTVGVIGFELLTGHLPIETRDAPERMHRLASADFDPLIRWRHDVPEPITDWLSRMMAMPRERRFASAMEARAALPEIQA